VPEATARDPAVRSEDALASTARAPDSTAAEPPPRAEPARTGRGTARRSSWHVLSGREFRLYFTGSLVSNLGTWLQNTAQVLLAYQLTRSVFAVGLIASAQFAGTLLVSPWAAVLADRIGRKATLISTQCASALIAGAMAWRYAAGMLGEHSLVVGALGLGIAFSLALPVQVALVPRLVDSKDAEAAMEMNSVSYNSGRALAPALCVLVLAFVGPGVVFALNAISFVVFAVVLARLEPATSGAAATAPHAEARSEPPRRAHATDGIRIALHHQRLLLLLAIVAAVTLADDPILVLSPALAHTGFHISSDWAGYFIAALGWGSVMGSVRPTVRSGVDVQRASKRAARSLLALGAAVIVFTAGVSPLISLLAAFAAGMAALFTGAAAQTAIVVRGQKSAASVAALWAIAWAGTKPIASLLDGWLAGQVGILITGILLAAPALLLALGELKIPDSSKRQIKNRAAQARMVHWISSEPSRH